MSELPPGWASARLPDLVAEDGVFNDGDWVESKDQDPNGGVRLIQLADVGDGHYRNRSDRFLTEEKAKELGCTFLAAGDVLISRMADPLGRACLFPGDLKPSATVVDVCIFRPGSTSVDATWAKNSINAPQFRAEIDQLASGTTRKRISRKNLGSLELPLPPLPEQRRIVAKIEALQERSRRAREALEAIPPLLDKFRQSVLAAAFRGDLTADWRAKHPNVEPASVLLDRIRSERRRRWEQAELAKLKAKGKPPKNDNWKQKYQEPEPVDTSGLPELPDGWCWVSLDELLVGIRAGKSPQAQGHPARDGEFGVLKVSAVSWGRFRASENKALRSDMAPPPGTTVRKGDLLISRANTVELVGAVVLVEREHPHLMLSDKTLRLEVVEPFVAKDYLLFALRSSYVRREFESDATGTSDSMRNLSQGKIRSAPVALPPFEEQLILAERLRSAVAASEAAGSAARGANAQLTGMEQAILAKAFRGELVPQDPTDEPASALLERIRSQRKATAPKKKTRRPRTKH